MPSTRFAEPGTEADPLVLFATPDALEKVAIGSPPAVQDGFPQTWKVTVPVSLSSGSLKVALRSGVAELSCRPSFGLTSVGVLGAWFPVLFVIDTFPIVAVAAGLPVGVAGSRTIEPPPGCVYVRSRLSRR